MDYLPKLATIEQACAWLHAKTGQTWMLARLLECHLTPHFWVDHKPGYPQLFGHHTEGYLTRMVFQGDLTRMEADGTEAVVQMFTAYDETIVKVEPAWRFPLSELRFRREAVEQVAEIINGALPGQATTSPELDLALLATREQLIEAFGNFTGMDASWFDNLKDTPKLLAARKVTGQGGRNNAAPLFCPYEVMLWLVNPMRRKGKPMKQETGWRVLEHRFPRVFNARSAGDPRQD